VKIVVVALRVMTAQKCGSEASAVFRSERWAVITRSDDDYNPKLPSFPHCHPPGRRPGLTGACAVGMGTEIFLKPVCDPMRWAWGAIVVCAAAAGCLTRAERPSGTSVARSLAPAAPVEGVYLESVLLERPVGDRFLDRDLWAETLPVGSQEARTLLSENGLRAGVLAGSLPQRFQTMLESDSEALNGRGLTFAMRREEVLPTSGPHERCEFSLLADLAGKRGPVSLKQARCGVLVRPEALADGRVRVWCEPQIQHGEKRDWLRPSADGTGFVKFEEIPLARYPVLAFDAPLGRNEYLLIGWQADQLDTLGAALFGVSADGQPRQRVLVIRARQANPGNPPDLPSLGARRPSVAAEAARPRR
jgi:hypothetical protein